MTLRFYVLPLMVHGIICIQVEYWEIKPYVYKDKNGTFHGIMPDIIKLGALYCGYLPSYNFSNVVVASSRQEFTSRPYSNSTHLQNRIWAPIFSMPNMSELNLTTFTFMHSKMVAIVLQSRISLPNKILLGISNSSHILFILCLMSVGVGIFVWFIESYNNTEFHKSFFKGAGTGIWWSFVSMTTVGYGDVVPQSAISRILACVWNLASLILVCLMTATISDSVSGISDFKLRHKLVAVLKDSLEGKIAIDDYNANISVYESYNDVFDAVRHGNAYAALINADIAAWNQREIYGTKQKIPLSIIKEIDVSIPAKIMFEKHNNDFRDIIGCIMRNRQNIVETPTLNHKRYCKIVTVYYNSTLELLKSNIFMQVLVGVVIGLFLLILCLEAVFICKRNSDCLTHTTDNNGDIFTREVFQQEIKKFKLELINKIRTIKPESKV